MSEVRIEHFDGYDVTVDENGVSSITVPDGPKTETQSSPIGFFARLLDWFKKSPVTPYAKIRDAADPTGDRHRDPYDMDAGSDGKIGGEIGIKIRF